MPTKLHQILGERGGDTLRGGIDMLKVRALLTDARGNVFEGGFGGRGFSKKGKAVNKMHP